MGTTTSIEWCDATLNLAWGCTKISKGCDQCYMFRLSGIARRDPDTFQVLSDTPEKVAKAVSRLGKKPKTVFLNSMSDTFHKDGGDKLVQMWFDVLKETPHKYIVLTKRANRLLDYATYIGLPNNVWVGVSVETRKMYHRVATLRKVMHHTKFLSLEPMLDSMADVDLTDIQWVIVGGESDYKSPRPFNMQWAREIRDKCIESAVPFFFKQSGGTTKNAENVWGTNILDGRKHLDMPHQRPTPHTVQETLV